MDANILAELDKKIRLKFIKEGKASRTYIIGLESFFSEDMVQTIVQRIKKSISTSYFKKVEDERICHGYNGDHRIRIRKILVDDYKIPTDKIHDGAV